MASSSPSEHVQKPEEHNAVEESMGEGNVLQKHIAFFDRNHDGIIYPWETYQGFRAIGCGIPLSTISAIFIHLALSSKTRSNPGRFPSLLFPIEVANIHRGKHGSDSGVYDTEGRFVTAKFEEIFKKHARTHPSALTSDELYAMLKSNRDPQNYRGWFASWTEWKLLYDLCKDKKGLLHRNKIRTVYDGTVFEQLEKEKAESKSLSKKES